MFFHMLGDLIEQFVKSDEARTLHVPVCVLGLVEQIDHVCQALVEQGDAGGASRLGHVEARPVEEGRYLDFPSSSPLGVSSLANAAGLKRCLCLRIRTASIHVDVEIPLSARWRGLPPRRRSEPHCAERRRDADPDSCRPSPLACWQASS